MQRSALGPSILLGVSLAIAVVLPCVGAKKNTPKDAGARTFKQYCAKCHFGGANSVEPKRPIIGSKQLSSITIFKTYLSAPPGHMPYYDQIVKDRETLDALYKYCKSLKKPTEKETMLPGSRIRTISMRPAGDDDQLD